MRTPRVIATTGKAPIDIIWQRGTTKNNMRCCLQGRQVLAALVLGWQSSLAVALRFDWNNISEFQAPVCAQVIKFRNQF
ncbi:MAG TPA: hypothetical protein VGZ25_17220, partial [Gemmataceae bacterium]|nr:hypothetical protein [Gemmataceae bacterium]